MWCLVLVFLLPSVFHICSCQDVQVIKLVLKKDEMGKLYCPSDEVVAPKIPANTKITVNVESELDISNNILTCKANGAAPAYRSNVTKHKDNNYVGRNLYPGNKLTKNWMCEFDKINVICKFYVTTLYHNEPYIQANGINTTDIIRSSNKTFDAVGTYEYSEGLVNFTCHVGNQNENTLLQLSSNAHGTINANFRMLNTEVFLYLKLTAECDGAFVECRASDFYNIKSFVTRIYLRLMKSKTDPTAIIEAPTKCKDPSNSIKTDEKSFCINGPVIEGLPKTNILGMLYKNATIFSIVYEYQENETLDLVCDAPEAYWSGYNDSTVEEIKITEITASKKFGSFKLKLNVTRANIDCTTHFNGKKVTEIVLIPKKSSGKTITLTNAATLININKDPGNSPTPTSNPNEEEKDDHTVVIIMITICTVLFISVLLFVIVRLFKRKPVVSPIVPDSNVNYETLPEHNKGPTPAPAQWQEVQYSAPADRIANNDYAVPFQPAVEELYSKPLPKNQRLKNNPAHASADNLNPTYTQPIPKHLRKDKLPYASVDNLTNASVKTQPYAQVTPKNQRKGVEVLPKGPEAAYAKLALKPAISKKPIMIESAYVEVMPHGSEYADSEHSYAEIKQENPYAEVGYADPNNFKAKGYVNVFKDSRYVNAEGKADYAEPAYCTINKD